MILHINDEFKYIVDVMNTCFGKTYKACFRGWYPLNKDKKTSAWFPKIADLKGKTPEPGDKAYGWCNTISDDGKYIYMNNFESPELLDKETPLEEEPHVTFIKLPKSDVYQYAGVFVRTYRDDNLGWVYKRIAEDIDTTVYL